MPEAPQQPTTERLGKREIAFSVLGAFLLWALIRSFGVQVYGISTGSMAGTLVPGDYVVTSNTVFGAPIPFTSGRLPALREPHQGEVVVYRPAGNDPVVDVIKRVIGLPGDTVEMRDRVVYRNGKPLSEPYVEARYARDVAMRESGPYGFDWHLAARPAPPRSTAYQPSRDSWGPLVVPPGHYFMLGDDRDESIDSRFLGFVPREEIRGKVHLIHYSGAVGARRSLPRPRWERIGRVR
jgi:signal peptidase I